MADNPTSGNKSSADVPAAEELKPKSETLTKPSETNTQAKPAETKTPKKLRHHGSYRPSHKATFIGLVVVGVILVINAVIITFVLKGQSSLKNKLNNQTVTISSGTLNKLGVNDTPIGDSGIQLTIGPNANFKNNLTVAGNETIAGQLNLNSKLSASNAALTQLEAGNTTLSQLNVNGSGTLSNLNVRSNLVVAGTTHFQGAVTTNQLFSVNNNLNVAGNLAVGGTLSAGSFEVSNLVVSGHLVTTGNTPYVSRGSAIGSNGTVSISGNDESGTIAVNAGAGASSGIVASVSFGNAYSSTPHVVVTPVGYGLVVYVNRSGSGFSIGVSSLTPLSGGNGYAFDYIVEQ